MNLRCAEIDELLAAFVLDALEDADHREVVEHLAECRLHDAELAELREVADALPLLEGAVAPPVALQSKVLRAFDATLAGDRPAALPPTVRPSKPGLLDLLRRPMFAYGLAAVLLIAGVGIGVAVTGGGEQVVMEAIVRDIHQDESWIRVVYVPDEGVAVLTTALPQLESGRSYQAWQITADGPKSLGVVPWRGQSAIPGDLSAATAIAISVEPAGGSAAPTTKPLMVLEL